MHPWELSNATVSEDIRIRSWATLKPSDFYFSAHGTAKDDETIICIVPIAYFSRYRHMLHESMPITHLLPKDLFEYQPSVFMTKRSFLGIYKALTDIGFSHTLIFQRYSETEGWSVVSNTKITDAQ